MKVQASLKRLFVSQTRLKLIGIFFYYPNELYYVRQLVRLTGEEINSVRRELENLKKAGIIDSEWRGNRLYYWANKQNQLFSELVSIAHKNTGLGCDMANSKESIGQVKLLIYSYNFAVWADGSEDDIDFIIVGDVNLKNLEPIIKKEEERRGRELNYMIMDKNELQLRKQKRDQFIVDFFLDCPIVIIGSPQEITNI